MKQSRRFLNFPCFAGIMQSILSPEKNRGGGSALLFMSLGKASILKSKVKLRAERKGIPKEKRRSIYDLLKNF